MPVQCRLQQPSRRPSSMRCACCACCAPARTCLQQQRNPLLPHGLLPHPAECCTTYRVGPLDHVMFNGMQCPMLASTGGDLPAAPAAEAGGTAAALLGAAAPAAAWAPGSGPVLQPEVQVDYTAIEYLGQPLTSTFSQILLRWEPASLVT